MKYFYLSKFNWIDHSSRCFTYRAGKSVSLVSGLTLDARPFTFSIVFESEVLVLVDSVIVNIFESSLDIFHNLVEMSLKGLTQAHRLLFVGEELFTQSHFSIDVLVSVRHPILII
jgi:hypothetical protein